jgi:mono/diheme cytochrome c family protein
MTKIHFKAVSLFIFLTYSPQLFSQSPDASPGLQLFKSNCAACHSIGGGKLVGPDLIGVTQKRSEEWLIKWIKSSQSLIKTGDKDAIAVFNEYNKIVMTDFAFLKDDEVKSIISYMETESNSVALTAATPVAADPAKTAVKDNTWHFSTFDYFFFGIILILLIVVFTISRRISKWADQLGDIYENERAFYKKY